MSKTPIVVLGDIAQFIRGINFKPDDVVPLGTEGSVACMRTKNVQSELDLTDVWAVAEGFVRREEQLLQAGDILVSSANSWNLVGKCSWIPELPWRASFGGFVSVLRANPAHVDARFLYQWFAWEHTQALLRSFGQKTTNISNLNIDRALALKLPLPPVEEQRRIAAILDQAETLRTQRRTALALLDSLTQSLFLDMFGDLATNPKRFQAKSLCEVATFYGGNSLPSGLDFTDQVGGYFLMKVSDMNLPGNEREILQCQSWSDVAGSKASTCPVGSIVVPKRGGAIGTNKKRITTRPTVLDPNLMAICPDPDQLNQEFLFQWFLGFDLASIASGSSVPQLNKQDLAPLTMLVPPLPLPQTFATRIASIQALKATHRRALAALDALFASLQQRAFAGQL